MSASTIKHDTERYGESCAEIAEQMGEPDFARSIAFKIRSGE